MSQKEVDRALILARVKEQTISLKKASKLLFLSYSHTKRLSVCFKKEGPKGLISKKRGKKSNRAICEGKQKEIIKIICKYYRGCKPLFISEKLEQYHNINYSSEFIRQLMIKHHLWIPKVKKVKVHQRRKRRDSEGELVQLDASDHDWFEERGPRSHLHIFIDDATSKIYSGYFTPEETTEGYYRASQIYFEKEGRPISLYSDKRGTFKVNQGNTAGDTQFGRAMKELQINIIFAHSPQAKGRVERAFKTLQERLVWEMRIRGISCIEKANEYLPEFLEKHNQRYSEPPASSFNAHRPLNPITLKYILSTKETRTVSKNLEVQYNNQTYQLKPPINLELKLKKAKITAITTLEKELVFDYQGTHIEYVHYSELLYQKPKMKIEHLLNNWKDGQRLSKKPPRNHPWR